MSLIQVDNNSCLKCGLCIEACPGNIMHKDAIGGFAAVQHEELCVSCGQCVAICPDDVISHKNFLGGSLESIDKEKSLTAEQVFNLIKTRRSIRSFKDMPVEKEKIEKIIEAACYAPNAHNHQSTEYIVIRNKDVLDEISKYTAEYLKDLVNTFKSATVRKTAGFFVPGVIKDLFSMLEDFNKVAEAYSHGKDLILRDCPALIVFHGSDRIGFSDVNASLALQNATYMAQGLELGSFYCGYVVATAQRTKNINKLLGLPKHNKILGALAIGHPNIKHKRWIERKTPKTIWL
ncbi:nitroreductase family protein [Wukongibacter baidiensis]|uniref:nitroreductase family protein n=1 Tax=Wukongibacter baidiensis TaxID=1723361 RepID=UPI003D7F2A5B